MAAFQEHLREKDNSYKQDIHTQGQFTYTDILNDCTQLVHMNYTCTCTYIATFMINYSVLHIFAVLLKQSKKLRKVFTRVWS